MTAAIVSGESESALVADFARRGWTDGLPVTVPTAERVDAFFAAAGREPDEILLGVEENRRDVSVRLAAVNAVLAGCAPEHFPVVVAAIEGWADRRWGAGDRTFFYMSNASTGGGAQLTVVNGPVRRSLGMNSGTNLYAPASHANVAIGRALRLVLRNVLGFTPTSLDQATQGHPGKVGFCLAENEEQSPWEPLHVEHGFGADESTVMVMSGRGPEPIENRTSSSAEGILITIADTLSRLGAMIPGGPVVVVMGPEHADIVGSKHGWSKREARQFLYENFRRPVADLERAELKFRPDPLRDRTEGGVTYRYGARDVGDIALIVAGGRNAGISSVITSWCYNTRPGEFILSPVRTP
ncbi:hypothetical protein GCM10009836_42250 [Pseudonocardia ailaonensis]|uniref:Uncharacterized protein n=1 Tax=Pseudonocardia ailaonensis TaxID=367279 RepID=A0ABN2N8H1_9PSEU